jgi:folate-dependent phosphoribosylglycinamide formyltransferase PurN
MPGPGLRSSSAPIAIPSAPHETIRSRTLPRVVLICHTGDRIDTAGLSAWLASTVELCGIVKIDEPRMRLLARARRELRRVGWLRFFDVLAFRAYYALALARNDARWIEAQIGQLRSRYRGDPGGAEVLEARDPNSKSVASFLKRLQPDLVVARCKSLLKPEIYGIPACGTYVLHPGICPEYRNAHGCFWALANRDLKRVGMTMLRVDNGVDTGPVLLQSSCDFDEVHESHVVIQYRVVLENLAPITDELFAAWCGTSQPLETAARNSRVWGQPWLTAYLKWKHAARAAET